MKQQQPTITEQYEFLIFYVIFIYMEVNKRKESEIVEKIEK